ncbi:MAG: ABC transporter permease [Rhodobacteraceae bacterium]|jgi:ABC-type uncharacterized transport system permease subunit|nr:ABC transporter permease [Paracoccaceae bacterium]
MFNLFERRLAPLDSPSVVIASTLGSIVLALAIGAFLFIPFGTNPLLAYFSLFESSLGSLRGFGMTLNRAAPLILVALGTCVAWRAGFGFLGFEGCMTIGAAAAAWFALVGVSEDGQGILLPALLFWPAMLAVAFAAGGIWAGSVGVLRTRYGGNEVLISLMMNYVAIFLVQYLVSGPMRASGSLPQTDRFPTESWLATIIPGTRAHAGILIAVGAAFLVWLLISRMRVGFELVVTGLSPLAARYSGIDVGRRYLLAAVGAGGLGALAGLVEVLGTQHRLMDGLSGGLGFIGIVVALLAKLNPLLIVPVALLYAALSVGADALQRSTGVPSSIIFILQSLIVLFVMASDFIRYWRPRLPRFGAAIVQEER